MALEVGWVCALGVYMGGWIRERRWRTDASMGGFLRR